MPHIPGHPQASGGVTLESGPQSRLDALLNTGSGQQQRRGAAAAFEQLFTGQLSGQQRDLQEQLRKNRLARGLRGAAVGAAQERLGQGFEASNRVAGAQFLSSALGQNALPILQRVGTSDEEFRRFGSALGIQGIRDVANTPSFQAFSTEVAGLGALGLNQGAEAVNQRVEEALDAAGGDRREAFAALFGTAGLEQLQSILDPRARLGTEIGSVEADLARQIERLDPAATRGEFGSRGRAFLEAGEFTGVNFEGTDALFEKLGLTSPRAGRGGLDSILAGVSEEDLAQRAAEAFGFEASEGLRARFVGGLRGNRKEGTSFLAFRGAEGDIASQAAALANVTSSGFVRNRPILQGIRQNLQTLRSLQGFRSAAGAGLDDTSLLSRRQQELQRLEATGGQVTDQRTVTAPLSGNRRVVASTRQQSQEEFQQQLSRLRNSVSEINRFRTELFSPTTPFFT